MALTTLDCFPLEIWLQIVESLPPANIWKLRMVSRAWNEIFESDIVVDSIVRRCGFQRRYRSKKDILEHGEELESYERCMRSQMLKGHLLGRPRRHYTFDLDTVGHCLPVHLKLHGDRAMCCDDMFDESAEISVIDLDTGVKISSRAPGFSVAEMFLTDRFYGGVDVFSESLFWIDLTSSEHNLEQESHEENLGRFVAHGDFIACLDWSFERQPFDLVRIFNIDTKKWTYFPTGIDAGLRNRLDYKLGLTLDGLGVSVFYLLCEPRHVLGIKRWTVEGLSLFDEIIPFDIEEPFSTGRIGFVLEIRGENDQYELRSNNDRILFVDVGRRNVRCAPNALTASWKSHIYSFDRGELRSSQLTDGELQPNSILDWPKYNMVRDIAVNDRWLCVVAQLDSSAVMEVYDFCEMSAGGM